MGIEVTEHAAMRWLERVEGVDMFAVKRRMMPLRARQRIKLAIARGAADVTVDGITSCLAPDGAVTTVWPAGAATRPRPRRGEGR